MYRFGRALKSAAVTAIAVSTITIGSPVLNQASAAPSTVASAQEVALTPTGKPDPVALMSDFTKYWTARPYDTTNDTTKADTAFRGTVLDPAVLNRND
ncbi:hypothetical protein SAMN05443377_102137 [Propionibacterium cyclohexanicum]|uniref:Uncharacterized protein n=1 Tax=Propionibacterium cyclohexanicum TaxID=64702 RepID=A0A1H9Q579_9ACTN|nr:hypothetical protein [Propionibacterium cyclohexanicum]SER55597.1 hypothetical protein SAMN05443377_102137 [Propionibacterium cyclohexanicum]